MNINPKTFEELLLKRRLTQADVARRANLDPKTIGRIKRGSTAPNKNTAERIAKALGVTLEHLQSAPDSASDDQTDWSDYGYPIYRMVVDLDAQTLNNLETASWRYGLPKKSILQYAPILFSIFAELSLMRRKNEVQAFASTLQDQLSASPLPIKEFSEATQKAVAEQAGKELESINALNLAGQHSGEYWTDGWRDGQNAFLQFLEGVAAEAGLELQFAGCTLEDLCCYTFAPLELWEVTKHAECSEFYLGLAEHALHEGQALLRKMPKKYFAEDAAVDRVMWLASQFGGAKGEIDKVDAFFAQIERSNLDSSETSGADSPKLQASNAAYNGSLQLSEIPEELFDPKRADELVRWAAKHFGGGDDA